MKKIFFVLVFFCFLATAAFCGQSTWPPDYRAKVTNRIYKVDYQTVFEAVLDCMENNAFPVVSQNKQSGVIVTDYVAKPGIFAGKGELRLDFLVRKVDENSTKVRLNIKCQTYSRIAGAMSADNYIDEGNYEDFFTAIDNEIKNALRNQGQPQEQTKSSGPNTSPYAFPSPKPDAPSVFRSTE
jgi:hypothetical protein